MEWFLSTCVVRSFRPENVQSKSDSNTFDVDCFNFLPDHSTLSGLVSKKVTLNPDELASAGHDRQRRYSSKTHRGARALYDGIPGKAARVCVLEERCQSLLSQLLQNLRQPRLRPHIRDPRFIDARNSGLYKSTPPESLGDHICKIATKSAAARGKFSSMMPLRSLDNRFMINHFLMPEKSPDWLELLRQYWGANASREQLRRRHARRHPLQEPGEHNWIAQVLNIGEDTLWRHLLQERIHYAASLIQALGRGALCRLGWARTLSHHRLNEFENLAKSEMDCNAAEEFPTITIDASHGSATTIDASHGSATELFSKTTSNVRQNNNPEIIEHRYPNNRRVSTFVRQLPEVLREKAAGRKSINLNFRGCSQISVSPPPPGTGRAGSPDLFLDHLSRSPEPQIPNVTSMRRTATARGLYFSRNLHSSQGMYTWNRSAQTSQELVNSVRFISVHGQDSPPRCRTRSTSATNALNLHVARMPPQSMLRLYRRLSSKIKEVIFMQSIIRRWLSNRQAQFQRNLRTLRVRLTLMAIKESVYATLHNVPPAETTYAMGSQLFKPAARALLSTVAMLTHLQNEMMMVQQILPLLPGTVLSANLFSLLRHPFTPCNQKTSHNSDTFAPTELPTLHAVVATTIADTVFEEKMDIRDTRRVAAAADAMAEYVHLPKHLRCAVSTASMANAAAQRLFQLREKTLIHPLGRRGICAEVGATVANAALDAGATRTQAMVVGMAQTRWMARRLCDVQSKWESEYRARYVNRMLSIWTRVTKAVVIFMRSAKRLRENCVYESKQRVAPPSVISPANSHFKHMKRVLSTALVDCFKEGEKMMVASAEMKCMRGIVGQFTLVSKGLRGEHIDATMATIQHRPVEDIRRMIQLLQHAFEIASQHFAKAHRLHTLFTVSSLNQLAGLVRSQVWLNTGEVPSNQGLALVPNPRTLFISNLSQRIHFIDFLLLLSKMNKRRLDLIDAILASAIFRCGFGEQKMKFFQSIFSDMQRNRARRVMGVRTLSFASMKTAFVAMNAANAAIEWNWTPPTVGKRAATIAKSRGLSHSTSFALGCAKALEAANYRDALTHNVSAYHASSAVRGHNHSQNNGFSSRSKTEKNKLSANSTKTAANLSQSGRSLSQNREGLVSSKDTPRMNVGNLFANTPERRSNAWKNNSLYDLTGCKSAKSSPSVTDLEKRLLNAWQSP